MFFLISYKTSISLLNNFVWRTSKQIARSFFISQFRVQVLGSVSSKTAYATSTNIMISYNIWREREYVGYFA